MESTMCASSEKLTSSMPGGGDRCKQKGESKTAILSDDIPLYSLRSSQQMSDSSQKRNREGGAESLVLIVILNWNSPEGTVTAVESVLRMDYPNFHVLIVENGSTDNSAAELRKITGSRVELLESAVNNGYTGGCNLGFVRALDLGAEYVWLLNNDAVVAPDTLSSLVALAESDLQIGLVTPVIASLDEVPHITFAGGLCNMNAAVYEETNDGAVAKRWAAEHPASGLVIVTAMLIR